MAQDPSEHVRTKRTVDVAHSEAFQLMLYVSREIPPDRRTHQMVWIWNSRDGVTPYGITLEGVEYNHAIHGYQTRYTAALPLEAAHVFIDYSPAAWEQMLRDRWQRMADHPKSEWHDPEQFKARFPTAESFVPVEPYRPGEPRRVTREQFLAETHSWMGRVAVAGELEPAG